MALFNRLDKLTSRAVDRVNATRFVLTPMKSTPNGRPSADPGRKVIRGRGIFDYVEMEYGVQLGVRKSYREGNDLRSVQSGRDPQLSVDMIYFPGVDEAALQGDLVSFPDEAQLPDFQVTKAQRDGMNRIRLDLVQIGGQT
ncbi:hypothetical protein [Agrobacterium tumefaciens]|uniref:hypothetical protein n=1 Tax=Agrobacterium tumefaciens TaxID=358 RepID=UPI001572D54D|nr:hypothetical protein [Agrobacterium tumefaciens]NTD85489.1 hypothetical protein [Agrobacterium tumefaciens]NTD90838.1 hypothetical protein [Agrobacterium tumefaciens]NTE03660.1 hypothetical protein [Agrobacterium tumefaciens]NTE15912.1 hypothetical protein [Agrobacterium tumefaciens]NTE26486.1 hypothetical protein [Agrobacterium tumefaciens]